MAFLSSFDAWEVSMNVPSALLAIVAALLVGAMSPGPSFVVVARNSLCLSRGSGVATAMGMGAGGVCFGGVALAGLYTVLSSAAWLYAMLKMAGGAYLLYLALRIWRGASMPLALDQSLVADKAGWQRSFWMGLSTQLTNPKTAIVYGSIFAALLPLTPPLWCYVVLPILVFAIEAGWYTTVAICLSSPPFRHRYLGAKAWIDRLASVAIATLGLRLVIAAYERADFPH